MLEILGFEFEWFSGEGNVVFGGNRNLKRFRGE